MKLIPSKKVLKDIGKVAAISLASVAVAETFGIMPKVRAAADWLRTKLPFGSSTPTV